MKRHLLFFVLCLLGSIASWADGNVYTLRLADTQLYFSTNVVSGTYSLSSKPETFYVEAVDGGYTLQSTYSEKYVGYGTDGTDGWNVIDVASAWVIADFENPAVILRDTKDKGFGVDEVAAGEGIYTDKSGDKLAKWVLEEAEAVKRLPGRLENGDFDGAWEACHPWEKGDYLSVDKGTQPSGWRVSNVYNSLVTLPEVAAKVTNGEGNAVKLTNQSTSGQNVPAYVELGTPWATAETKNTSVRNQDGGSFGGIDYTYKPDAVTFDYMREKATSGDVLTLVAYLWKGTWTQAEVPSNTAVGIIAWWGTAEKVTMTDRDSNIMGKSHALGGAVSKSADAELVASLEMVSTDQSTTWQTMEVPFTYANADAAPAKLNIIVANTNYFAGKDAVVNGSTLTVDNVQTVFWNTLSSLTYNEVELLEGENTDFVVNEAYDAAKLSATAKSQFATVDVAYDKATAVATVTVKRDCAADKVYTVAFAPTLGTAANYIDALNNGDDSKTVEGLEGMIDTLLDK